MISQSGILRRNPPRQSEVGYSEESRNDNAPTGEVGEMLGYEHSERHATSPATTVAVRAKSRLDLHSLIFNSGNRGSLSHANDIIIRHNLQILESVHINSSGKKYYFRNRKSLKKVV